ncbi:MAG: acyltransferase family protein [Clostridia bacterium]|nr:acyltransferase family protein [Clostridia bacterium]
MFASRRADVRRIPELDGFRVLLVFIVSWYHFWQQSWLTPGVGSVSLDFLVRSGYMHVDGTILLSGFLLFLPYARSMYLGEALPDVRDFYRRRVMRIFPSYYFVIFATLFAVALPFGLFRSPQAAVKDIFTHLSFTFMFSLDTYVGTQLGAACWTLALEMQAYLLFPFVARQVMKRPAPVLGGMILAAFAWRAYWVWSVQEYNLVVNQLPSFLDVYALGIMGSMIYVKLVTAKPKQEAVRQLCATAVLLVCLWAVVRLLRQQATAPSQPMIQRGQMTRRFPFALLLLGVILSLPFAVRPVRFLMGNRVMKFLAGISMNYYLTHQTIAVHLKRLGIPASISPTPHYDSERSWQYAYTFLCFGISLLVATLITYLIEKPGARLLRKWFDRRDARRAEAQQASLRRQIDGCGIRPGETVLLESYGQGTEAVAALVPLICEAGGAVQVLLRDEQIDAALAVVSPESVAEPSWQLCVTVGTIPAARRKQLSGRRWKEIRL